MGMSHGCPLAKFCILCLLQSSMDYTTLGEAHGMISDLLADSNLPPNIASTLKIINTMIAVPSSFHPGQRPFVSPMSPLIERFRDEHMEEKVKDQPDLKEDMPLPMVGVSIRQFLHFAGVSMKVDTRIRPHGSMHFFLSLCVFSLGNYTRNISNYGVKLCNILQVLKWLIWFTDQTFTSSTLSLSLLSSKSVFSQPFKKSNCMSDVARICSRTIFDLSKLWKAKFSLLCDVILLVRLQEKFDIDHSQEWKGYSDHSFDNM